MSKQKLEIRNEYNEIHHRFKWHGNNENRYWSGRKKKLKTQTKFDPLIKLKVKINVKLEIKALYDSGSNVTLINQRIAELLKLRLIEHKIHLKQSVE